MSEENVSPESQGQESQQAASQPSDFVIPEAYSGKEWADNIKSVDELWSGFANAQSLIGQRPAGIPQNDAPQEDWDKFYTAKGRPESSADYKFSDIEGLPEGIDLEPFAEKARPILHAAGLSPAEADRTWQAFVKAEMESAQASQAKADEMFDKLGSELFGDNMDSISQSAQAFIRDNVDERIRGDLANATPQELMRAIAIADAAQKQIDKVKAEYGSEGKVSNGGEQASGVSLDDTRQELAQLRTSEAARDFTHADHKKTVARIKELSGIVQRSVK
jgi:flagellin-like hook-associated protein FlgL